ncbi:MAG TPA: cellulose binding domain-containing protein [Actinospica sp.]|nr:cellulose binding domain-containing protein [Actinospica sp.]
MPRTPLPRIPAPRVLPGRRRAARALAAAATALAAAAAPLLVQAVAASPAAAATPAATAYNWSNVPIGGGGFVPDIVFDDGAPNIVYARTDIGGVYRWNQSTSSWTPLMDWVGESNWNLMGAVSVAADPINTNKVWVAAGMYTNSWDPNDGAILRSSDQGGTWTETQLPFKLGGNMPGRGMGERLAVDPNDDNVLYFGAPSGHGLWKSTDSGVTWSQVANFPNVGDYVQDASDTTGYESDNEGVTWVAFDKSAGSSGSPTPKIFVGVADLQNTVYESSDGGSTWSRVAGQPTGFLAHKGEVDPAGAYLYLTTSNTGGPYDGSSGDVWKYAIATGTWTQISPVPSSNTSGDYFGYSGLSIDKEHPNTIMVTGYSSWWPDTFIYRSTDGGATWRSAWSFTSYPNRSDAYTMNISATPWLTFGAQTQEPVESPELGWMTEGLAIDPFNSNRMFYGTGATLFGTTDLTDWDSGKAFTIQPFVNGLEETAVNDLISPPTGAPLLSALGDLDGFVHTSLTGVPAMMYTAPNLSSGDSLDYAGLDPSDIVRTGEINKTSYPNVNRIGFSTDGGTDWWQASTEPPGVTGGGRAAIAADGSSVVWSPAGTGVYYSTDYGSSWTASTGIPAGAVIASDRVNPKVYYGYSAGTLYLSTNGGQSFAATAATGLPATGTVYLKALPGVAGDVWLAGGPSTGTSGIWHSADEGASFSRLTGVSAALNLGFGKSATSGGYPALYAIGTVGGVQGIFRSDDEGATWTRINDAQHQWGNIGAAITGDPNVYGRVYVGTNGRGIMMGVASGTSSTSASASASKTTASASASASSSTTASSSPTTSASASASPTVTATGFACHVVYTKNSEWAGGFTATVAVTDTGSASIGAWTVGFTFGGDQKITSAWNEGSYTQTGEAVKVTNASYNGAIAPGGNTSFGFQGTWTSSDAAPTAFTVNGAACA